MTEDQARKLEVPIKWNSKANVCVYCGRVPETFYVVTGHDHTDDSIRWCICREAGQYKDEITTLRQRVAELEKEPSVESGGEFKTWWEIALHVGAWKNHELDYVHFGSEMAVRAFAIHLLKQRDKEESQLIQTIAKLTAERDALKQQRDELLAALGSGGRHCNDDTPHSNLCEAIIDSKEADLGQGLDPFWKWAFRRGFHEAETSYKVDIATLEQQRDELLAALDVVREAVTRAHAGCAHVASGAHCNEARQLARASIRNLDTALSAIASVKEKA